MISLSVNGTPYTRLNEISVRKSLDTFSGVFAFKAVSSINFAFPFKVGDLCTVQVQDETIITGYIERI